jgi:hypothetical protein
MTHDRLRITRLNMLSTGEADSPCLEPSLGAADAFRGTPRFLGQVVNGGSMPGATDRVFLVNPVRVYGTEAEGVPPVLAVDSARRIPVVVIGALAPLTGDLLLALAVGGRWVAKVGGAASLPCSPCAIPNRNLTLSWTNALIGPGSTTLAFNPPSQWTSVCTNQIAFQLSCLGGSIQLAVTYFLSGNCPAGQSQSCVSPGSGPFAISLASFSCSPFLLQYTVTGAGCPVLWSDGYTAFTITE